MSKSTKLRPEEILRNVLAKSTCPQIILITSPDRIRRERISKLITDKFFPENQNIKKYNSKEINLQTINKISIESDSLSLFSTSKCFIFDNTQNLTGKIADSMKVLVDNISEKNTFIFLSKELKKTSLAYKHFSKDTLIALDELKDAPLKKWIVKEVKKSGLNKFPGSLIDHILTIGENSADNIFQMIEQMALFANNDELTEDEFWLMFEESKNPNDFNLLEMIRKQSFITADILNNKLFKANRSAFLLLSLISRSNTQYTQIKSEFDKGLNEGQVRNKMNLRPWIFKQLLSYANHESLDKLISNTDAILKADARLKDKSLGEELIISELLNCLCSKKSQNLSF